VKKNICLIGVGNIGSAIASGLAAAENFSTSRIILTRRRIHLLDHMKKQGFQIESDNIRAVEKSEIVIVAVEPQQVVAVLQEIGPSLNPDKHILISIVTGISTVEIRELIGKELPIIRAMPNTAIAVRESMTCLASEHAENGAMEVAETIFSSVGKTLVIKEEHMIAATALGACGVAFFLRAIRAASQGGIEIGFHAHEALAIAAQTARGAATLILVGKNHPEHEIDRVTTPRGCTIAGLNHMEHEGFSSAMIKGITISAQKAACLYTKKD